jgi:hypothetical protein
VAILIGLPGAAEAEWLEFAQADVSQDTKSLVFVKALRSGEPLSPLLSAVYTRWDVGSTGSLGYMHRWALTSGDHAWSVGAGVGANAFRSSTASEENENALSLRAQSEISGPAPGGRYYALVQLSTFRNQVFALAQYDHGNSPLGLELSAVNETKYHHTKFALRYALDSKRHWQLRAGVILKADDTEPFIGLAFNGF